MLLETVVASNVVSLPLKLLKPSIYATALDNDKYLVNAKMYLAISAETSQAEIVNKTPNLVKTLFRQPHRAPGAAGAGRCADGLSAAASGGDSREVELPVFRAQQAGPAWESVQRARNFAAYIPGDLPNPQAELIIVLPQSK